MKNLNQIIVAVFILTSMFSCQKDENKPKEDIKNENISAKWIVNDVSDYESFEFNISGNYIVVKNTSIKSTNSQNIYFGTYKINGNTIILSDFGTLKVSTINNNSISFSFHPLNSKDVIMIDASKHDEMEKTTRTTLLCRTWQVITYNGENVTGTKYDATILFSASGTYFVKFANPNEDQTDGMAYWKWKDETEIKFLYTWDYPEWDEQDEVEILELTDNTLKFLADWDELYELEPVINSKSAIINTDISTTNNKGKRNLWGLKNK